ncbi:MAG: DNA repair protein RecO [Bacilli bacterium]|nr:DNA repair protein RecO [Bacilli bacterium]
MATNNKKTKNIKGYVIRISPYKETDAMVTVLAEDGLYSFGARGVKNPNQKNFSSVQTLSYSSFTLSEGEGEEKIYSLKEGICLESVDGKHDFARLAIIQFITEVSQKMSEGEGLKEKYALLRATMQGLNSGFDPLTLATLYLAGLLRVEGYAPNTGGCSVCGEKKDIIGFSMIHGGYLCRQHLENQFDKKDPRTLKIARYIFNVTPDKFVHYALEKSESLEFIRDLADLLAESTGIKLHSLLLVNKI